MKPGSRTRTLTTAASKGIHKNPTDVGQKYYGEIKQPVLKISLTKGIFDWGARSPLYRVRLIFSARASHHRNADACRPFFLNMIA